MGSYLDRRDHETAIAKRDERPITREVDPMIEAEKAEARAEKQRRVNEQMAIAARRLSGDPEILAQDAAYAEERQRQYEKSQEEAEQQLSSEPDYY